MNALISIIIPVYKVEDYIHRCVNSLLRQTYKNLEIILVEDGSPDRCGEICDEYATLDNRVKVIHKKNGGLSDARNAGIDICKGDYIAFIDSDDWINDIYIEKLYQLLKQTNSDIAVCNFIRTSIENIKVDILEEQIYEYSNIEALAQFEDEFYVQMVIACGKLYKSNLFKGIRFPVGKLHEDEFTTYKVIFNAKKITLTTMQLYYYWQRECSIMGNGFSLKGGLDAIEAIEERANFLGSIKEILIRDKTLRTVFNKYKTVNDNINLFGTTEDKIKFRGKFIKFKAKLRETNQCVAFKIYYELYYIMPKLTNKILKIYKRVQ